MSGSELYHPFGSSLSHIDRSVFSNRKIVDRVEHRIARASEADRVDDGPVAIELHDAGVLRVVVRAANPDVEVARGVGGHGEDAARRLRVLHADPLPLERAVLVEQLESRVLAI